MSDVKQVSLLVGASAAVSCAALALGWALCGPKKGRRGPKKAVAAAPVSPPSRSPPAAAAPASAPAHAPTADPTSASTHTSPTAAKPAPAAATPTAASHPALAAADALREQANRAFSDKDFQAALNLYQEALDVLSDADLSDHEATELKYKILSNSTFTLVKLGKHREAITSASVLLEESGVSVDLQSKTLYRRATSLKELGLTGDALADLARAEALPGVSGTLLQSIQQLKAELGA